MSAVSSRLSIVVALVALLVAASSASAKTFTVTKQSDPKPGKCKKHDCSLREAAIAANKHNGKDTISLPSSDGAYKLTRTPPVNSDESKAKNGDIDLTGKTTVKHSGKGRATVDANGIDRAFDVQHGAPSSFNKLVITGGKTVGPQMSGRPASARGIMPIEISPEGGGIRNAATITVKSSVIEKNQSLAYGGGIGVVGGAGLNLIKSTVTKNVSPSTDGGGIDGDTGKIVIKKSKITANKAAANGGAMYFFSDGKSKIDQSTISGNRAGSDGGAIRESGGGNTKLTITNSTLSGNKATGAGGAILVASDVLSMTNSTIASNTAASGGGGGIALSGGPQPRGNSVPPTASLNAVTVVGNKASAVTPIIQLLGGGLQNLGTGTLFKVENSLIALNFSGTTRNDCAGSFDSGGHNLLGTNSSCTGFTATGDLIKPNPKVGSLKSNGGPTKTIALEKGSPAIDKASKTSTPSRDQRGHKRDNKPDIGAFER